MPQWLKLILEIVQLVIGHLVGSAEPEKTAAELLEHVKQFGK